MPRRRTSVVAVAVVVAVVVAVAVVPVARAWGPVAHWLNLCRSLRASGERAPSTPCFGAADALGYAGAELPDSFVFGSTSFGYYAPHSCPYTPLMHSLVLAGFVWRQAAAGDDAQRLLASGFASHLLLDAVGFNVAGGFLSHGLVAPGGAPVNWATMWPEMQTVDAFVATTAVAAGGERAALTNATRLARALESHWADVIATAATACAAADPSFTPLGADAVAACSAQWAAEQRRVVAWENFTATLDNDAADGGVFARLRFFRAHDTSASAAAAVLANNLWCSSAAYVRWQSSMRAGASPNAAAADAVALVDALFAKGTCQSDTPPPPSSSPSSSSSRFVLV